MGVCLRGARCHRFYVGWLYAFVIYLPIYSEFFFMFWFIFQLFLQGVRLAFLVSATTMMRMKTRRETEVGWVVI